MCISYFYPFSAAVWGRSPPEWHHKRMNVIVIGGLAVATAGRAKLCHSRSRCRVRPVVKGYPGAFLCEEKKGTHWL